MINIISIQWIICTNNKNKDRYPESKIEEIKEYLKKYQSLFQEHRDQSVIQPAFLIILVARGYIFVLVLTYLFHYPFIQLSIVVLLSLIMFLYLVIKKPLKDYIDLGQYILQEITMLTAKVAALTLAVFDKWSLELLETREVAGNVILYSQVALSAIQMLYICIQSVKLMMFVYQAIKKSYEDKSVSILEVSNGQLESNLQPQQMGFSVECSELKDISDDLIITPSVPKTRNHYAQEREESVFQTRRKKLGSYQKQTRQERGSSEIPESRFQTSRKKISSDKARARRDVDSNVFEQRGDLNDNKQWVIIHNRS